MRSGEVRFQQVGRLRYAVFAGIGVEVGAISGGDNKARTDGEIAETLALLPLRCVSGENKIKRGNDARVIEVLGVEFVHTRSVEGRAQIQIVSTRAFADQTDLGEIGPRASVRAPCHADDDIVRGKAVRRESFIKGGQQIRQVAFAFGKCEPASRERNTGH